VFRRGDRTETVTPRARLIVNQAEIAVTAAVAGRGLTRVLSYQMAAEHRAGQLEIVLEAFEPPPIPVHVVHQDGRRASARVRALVDILVDRLRADPVLR
jgi:DNA-binding transcriptional LysR family regulator